MDPRQGDGQTPSDRQLRLSALWTWCTLLHWQTCSRGADAILHIKGACAFILPLHPTHFPCHSVLLTLFFFSPSPHSTISPSLQMIQQFHILPTSDKEVDIRLRMITTPEKSIDLLLKRRQDDAC